jgi:hypothetical protein
LRLSRQKMRTVDRQDGPNAKTSFPGGLSTGLKSLTERGPSFAVYFYPKREAVRADVQLVFLCKQHRTDNHDYSDGNRY